MYILDDLSDQLTEYLEPKQIEEVVRAYHFAAEAHEGQFRRSGEPYVSHPLAVAGILAGMHMDHQSLMAAMLHDVIEDTRYRKDDLASEFGEVCSEGGGGGETIRGRIPSLDRAASMVSSAGARGGVPRARPAPGRPRGERASSRPACRRRCGCRPRPPRARSRASSW